MLFNIFRKANQVEQRQKMLSFSFPETHMLLISDLHGCSQDFYGLDPQIYKNADVCILMGDIYWRELLYIHDRCEQYNTPLYAIPGNHEPVDYIEKAGITNIHGKTVILSTGIRIAGLGGCQRYKNNPELCMMTNEQSVNMANSMSGAEILISHSNPLRDNKCSSHSGLQGINEYIRSYQVPIHFYGHLHEPKDDILPNGTRSICIYRVAAVTIDDDIEVQHIF